MTEYFPLVGLGMWATVAWLMWKWSDHQRALLDAEERKRKEAEDAAQQHPH